MVFQVPERPSFWWSRNDDFSMPSRASLKVAPHGGLWSHEPWSGKFKCLLCLSWSMKATVNIWISRIMVHETIDHRVVPPLYCENPGFLLGKPLFSQLFQLNAEKFLALCWEYSCFAPEFYQSRLQCFWEISKVFDVLGKCVLLLDLPNMCALQIKSHIAKKCKSVKMLLQNARPLSLWVPTAKTFFLKHSL